MNSKQLIVLLVGVVSIGLVGTYNASKVDENILNVLTPRLIVRFLLQVVKDNAANLPLIIAEVGIILIICGVAIYLLRDKK